MSLVAFYTRMSSWTEHLNLNSKAHSGWQFVEYVHYQPTLNSCGILAEFLGFVTDILCFLLCCCFSNVFCDYSSHFLITEHKALFIWSGSWWMAVSMCIPSGFINPAWEQPVWTSNAPLEPHMTFIWSQSGQTTTTLYFILETSSEGNYGRCWQTDQI